MSGLSSIWLMIGLIQWANKLSSCDSTVGLHVLRWKWTGHHYAHILPHQWRELVHLHAWTRMRCKNSSENSWIMHLYWQIHRGITFIMDYGSYQPYGQLICKTLSYRENVWGYTITIIRMTANQVIYISWMKLGQPRQNPGLQAHLVRHSQSSCLPTVSKSCTKHLTTLLCSRTYSAFEYTYFPTIYTMEKAMCQMNTVYKKYQTQNWWAAYGGTS